MSLYYYNPNAINQKFVRSEKDILTTMVNNVSISIKQNHSLELFILNNYIKNIRSNQHVQTILQRLYGMGLTRSFYFSRHFTYFADCMSFKNLTLFHRTFIADLIEEKQYLLKDTLFRLKKINIASYRLINCYKGIRHSLYLPVRGQRTHSNAHVARYLGSGTFEYVPKVPSLKIKKLSKYSRRKIFLVEASTKRYQRLLNKNFQEFAKNNKSLFKQLVKKNKLGAFSALYKEKQKQAKLKLKKG